MDDAQDDDQSDRDKYNSHKRRVANKARQDSTDARDIGRIPRVKNHNRRKACERDLRRYLLTYFPDSFPLEFSEDHERIIKEIEYKVLHGGLKAIAMPRGSGKTTILIRAGKWALSYGHRRFLMLIEADGTAAEESMDVVKMEFETNERLHEDFPEICVPIRALQGIVQRANAQTCLGDRTLMTWEKRTLILPTVPGSKAANAIFACSGILGRIRGRQIVTTDGKTIRPDFVLINDPQTDISARSELECAKRERVINGGVLGLAGPGSHISGFAAVTVIREGDAADRMLNKKLSPKWHGERCKLVYTWPSDNNDTAKKLWDRYLELRAEEIDAGDDHHPKANAHYVANRKAMDKGAKVGWPSRFMPHEISAIQHAYGLRQDYPDTFDAEYQNEPRPTITACTAFKPLTSDEYCLRVLDTHKRGELPDWVENVTLGIDVQKSTFWWAVLATSPDFDALVIDYGVWPDQGIDYITLDQCDRTYARATKRSRPGEAVIAGLNTLVSELAARRYVRDDGTQMGIERGIVDSGYETAAVHRFCMGSPAIKMQPSKGFGITARQKPWESLPIKKGERRGFGYRVPPMKGVRGTREVHVDANRWKTFVSESFAMEQGSKGAWYLFRASPARHRMIADNLSAAYPTETTGQGRQLYEWSLKPNRDDHLFDAVILAGVGAAMSGSSSNAVTLAKRPKQREAKVKLTMAERKELARQKREELKKNRK